MSLARQVDGEYCMIKAEKAFTRSEAADAFSKNLAKKYAEVVQTSNGPVECVCERGVFEVDVVEE